jgi:hypothetical protein
MLESLLPQRIDNNYRGRKLALWIFALVVLMRALQSVMIIFNGYYTARNADGIPLELYPHDAAQTILAIFAVSSLWRLIICLICAVVLVRYRSAIPAMFIVLGLTYLGGQLLNQFIPLVRVGRPPGVIVNLILFGLIVIGFALSLWPRKIVMSDE